MRQGLDRLRENKLAATGCLLLVVVLTALGVWTNKTAERQGDIEKVVHTQVIQALCNQPFTAACLRRAINIVKTCRADRECAGLLAIGPDISRSQAESGFRVENPNPYETNNSSQGIRNQGEESGPRTPGSGEKPHDSDGKGGGEAKPAPATEPAPEESPGTGKGPPAKGLAPEAVESVEGIVGCVGKVDLACVLGEVGLRELPRR